MLNNFIKYRLIYGKLLFNYGVKKQKQLIDQIDTNRSQSHTYTAFYRSPGQLEALIGPVLKYLGFSESSSETLKISIFASSKGAETYTFASTLLQAFPNLKFEIVASDLHQEMVNLATLARYSSAEVNSNMAPQSFIESTFDKVNGEFIVKPEIRSRVTFKQANLLSENLKDLLPMADIVLAQNVFFHLDRKSAEAAFRNVVQFLKPKAALFIDGMELDMRERLTAELQLDPLNFKVRKIHEHACRHIGDRWWNYYYGMEPYSKNHKNVLRRYSSIFLKNEKLN